MSRLKLWMIAACMVAWIPASAPAAETGRPGSEVPTITAGAEYQVGPGDILNIEVWKDPSLTRQATVLPDGMVVFPMIGEVRASGKTVPQLKKEIGNRLAAFVKDAVVTVEVRQVTSLQVYVIGSVRAPGRFTLTSHIDVLQALATAGGFDAFAKKSRIRIFRREGGRIEIIPFDYDDIASGKNLESNIVLRRGDVVLVP